MEHLSLITKRGGQGGRKIPKRYYFGEHLGLYEGSRPLGEPVLWPLAARCLPVCVKPFVMFLPDGRVVKRTERAEMSLLLFFWTSWFLASSRVSGQSVSGRFSHLNLFVVIFWIPIFNVPTRNALGVQKFPPELGGVIHQQILDLFVCVN